MDANTAVAIVEIDGKFLNHGGWIFLFFMPKIMRLDAFQCLRCGDCGYYEKSKKGQISFSDEAGMPAWHMSFLGLTVSSVFLVAKQRAQRTAWLGMPKPPSRSVMEIIYLSLLVV